MNAKAILKSIAVLGLTLNVASAGHQQKVDIYASAVDREAHHIEDDVRGLFPHYKLLLLKSRRLATLAHSTEQMIGTRTNLHRAEQYVDLMQKLVASIDSDMHLIAETHGQIPGSTMQHLIQTMHKTESYLKTLKLEVHELNHPVLGYDSHHGHPHSGHFPHQGNRYNKTNNVVNRLGGLRFNKGGFGLNIKF